MTTFRKTMSLRRLESLKPQSVYFIQAGPSDGPVKIGVARDPWARMREIQTGNAEDLSMLGVAATDDAYALEATLHRRFQSARVRGEWFRMVPGLIREIIKSCGDECYLNGDADSMIGLLWPYGEDITPEMVRHGLVEVIPGGVSQ